MEYVLLFSPFVQGRNLITYQQVTHRTHESRLQASEVGKADCESITVEVGKDDVIIKLNSICHCRNAELRLGDMPMSSIMGATKTKDVGAACFDQKRTAQDEGETCEPAKAEGNTIGMIDESMPCMSEKISRRKRKLLRKMQRLKDGNGVTVTVGEFDFLFEQSIVSKQDCHARIHSSFDRKGLSQIEETMINHWEVSVKFLLYAGPWEVLGFKTPCHAAWKCSNQDSQEEEIMCHGDVERQHDTGTCRLGEFECVKKDDLHADGFLGCFLGPHVGETLYDRKARLMNQLTLSQNTHAASMLCKLFGSTRDEESKIPFNYSSGQNPCIISSRDLDEEIESQHAKVLRVSPRALLKGYLFYEYELWCQLHSKAQLLNKETWNSDADNSFDTELNPDHWMGWWTRERDFVNFARLPIREHNKWYIVPKLEWLSPVVIDGEDKERIQQVFSLDKFLIVAAKVAEEAERLNIPRKRRFLVAEVSWDTTTTSYHACDSTANTEGSIKGCGKWTEVSRGFLVEDTWPDSRLYKPHGYRISLLHGSQ